MYLVHTVKKTRKKGKTNKNENKKSECKNIPISI
jgi:hypothetical protein